MANDLPRLWKRITAGDQGAWHELVDTYAGLVYAEARKAGLDGPDAEDCAQHTWLALYRQAGRIRDPQAIPAWLLQTCRRRAVRMARQLGTTAPLPQDAAREPSDPPSDQPHSDLIDVLPAAIEQLDPRCRELIAGLYFTQKQRSYRQLAKDLGVDPNTIGPMRSRCLDRLRKILRKMGHDLH